MPTTTKPTELTIQEAEVGSADSLEKRGKDQAVEATSNTVTVTFEEHFDPDNPLQWPKSRKWINVLLISAQGTLVPIASTLPAVAAEAIAADFHSNSAVTPTLPVALFVLGLGIGPLYLAPLSELYGRRWVYLISFSLFTIINVGCALAPSPAALAVLRLLSGMAGSAGPSLGGASIGDMFTKKDRGKAQALYGFGPTGGSVLGSIMSGFVLEGTGSWRWLMWITVIAPGVTTVAIALFLRETYAPVILAWRAARLRAADPAKIYVTEGEHVRVRDKLLFSLSRPIRMLFTSPICSTLAIYVAVVYAILYLHLLSIGLLFGPTVQFGLFTYGWTGGKTGLASLGIGVGIVFGTILSMKFSNTAYKWMESRRLQSNGTTIQDAGNGSPESRVLLMQLGILLIPIGLVIFAWTAGRVHWIAPLLGAAIFATGMIIAYIAFQTYLVDAFGKFAASALATATILRSVVGCIFSAVGFELYRHLGYAWGTMLLAFICIIMLPVPTLLYFYGAKLRKKEFHN